MVGFMKKTSCKKHSQTIYGSTTSVVKTKREVNVFYYVGLTAGLDAELSPL